MSNLAKTAKKKHKTRIVTTTIQVKPYGKTPEDAKKCKDILFETKNKIFKIKNLVISHLSGLDSVKKQIITIQDKSEIKKIDLEIKKIVSKQNKTEDDKEIIEKLKKERNNLYKKGTEILKDLMGKAETTQIYDLIKREIPDVIEIIGTLVLTTIVQNISKTYYSHVGEVSRGERTLDSYKNDQPIPIPTTGMKLEQINNEFILKTKIKGNVQLRLLFGRQNRRNYYLLEQFEDKIKNGDELTATEKAKYKYLLNWKNKVTLHTPDRLLVDKILNNEVKMCGSQIKYNKKKNKWYLLLTYEEPTIDINLDPEIIIGFDLGLVNNLVSYNNQTEDYKFYGKRIFDIVYQWKELKTINQSNLRYTGYTGHGRKKLLKHIKDNYSERVKTLCHNLANDAVDEILRSRAGTVKLEFLQGLDETVRKNKKTEVMIYGLIQELLVHKLRKYQVIVLFVDPYHTSKMCSECGEIGKRSGESFTCTNEDCERFGVKFHADKNAAKNITLSEKYVMNEKETTYYKLTKQKKQTQIV